MSKYDITGQKFGYLIVLERDKTSIGQKNSKWICKCECGKIKSFARCLLVSGHTKSCGCKLYGNTNAKKHGMYKSKLYKVWANMRKRCYNSNEKDYKTYQGRKITVCKEWNESFISFYNWAVTNGYKDGLTIDRIDNDKGYFPDNCRWITNAEQQLNKRNTVKVVYNGEEIPLVELCRILNKPYNVCHARYTKLKKNNLNIDLNKILY